MPAPLTHLVGSLTAAVTLVVTGCSSSGGTAHSTALSTLDETTAGNVTVRAVPTRFDATSAQIKLQLDTHSGELDLPLPQAATLAIAGRPWPTQGWHGDPAGGHHREGTLRFAAAGPLTGTARLTLTGLPGPVQLSWPVPEAAHTAPST